MILKKYYLIYIYLILITQIIFYLKILLFKNIKKVNNYLN